MEHQSLAVELFSSERGWARRGQGQRLHLRRLRVRISEDHDALHSENTLAPIVLAALAEVVNPNFNFIPIGGLPVRADLQGGLLSFQINPLIRLDILHPYQRIPRR